MSQYYSIKSELLNDLDVKLVKESYTLNGVPDFNANLSNGIRIYMAENPETISKDEIKNSVIDFLVKFLEEDKNRKTTTKAGGFIAKVEGILAKILPFFKFLKIK